MAVGIIRAAVERCSALCFLFDNITAAFGAFRLCFENKRFCILTLGITRASKEFAKSADLDNHISAALVANNIGFFFLKFDFNALHFLFGFFKRLFKIIIIEPYHINVVFITGVDFIEIVLHTGSIFYINDIRQFVFKKIRYSLAEFRRNELLTLADNIFLCKNCRSDCNIC